MQEQEGVSHEQVSLFRINIKTEERKMTRRLLKETLKEMSLLERTTLRTVHGLFRKTY